MYYPDVLKFSITPEPIGSYQDSEGHWVVPEQINTPVEFEVKCRYETNDSGKTTISNDGSSIAYGGIVYMSVDENPIPEGLPVEVFNGDLKIASGLTKRFKKGMMNARLWV